MRSKKISTLAELELEIHRLKLEYKQQENDLGSSVKTYFNQFSISALLKKYATPSGLLKIDEQLNISSRVMSILLPLILNKTLFRGSGLITKALGAIITGKLGKSIDGEHISGLVNIVKGWFKKSDKPIPNPEIKFKDYGIPPDSETF
ncbi:MAG: hypothetical protein EOO99_07705 [Pedobacter sp.]|jgi:hypothetical protein|nr:MAG: hypothetical protein EOO99_07705 [Pedobacter sp.]